MALPSLWVNNLFRRPCSSVFIAKVNRYFQADLVVRNVRDSLQNSLLTSSEFKRNN